MRGTNTRICEIIPLVNDVLKKGKLLAAICGATGFLAENGYLDNVRHTSNDLEHYLKQYAPHYKGDAHYVKQHAVTEGNLIHSKRNGYHRVCRSDLPLLRFTER